MVPPNYRRIDAYEQSNASYLKWKAMNTFTFGSMMTSVEYKYKNYNR